MRLKYYVLLFCYTAFLNNAFAQTAVSNVKPPVAERIPYTIDGKYGQRVDYYYWMKNRGDKKVIDYLTDENKYVNAVMESTKPLQDTLYNEMKNRIKENEQSLPYKKGDYYYYTRYEPGGDYPVYCRKKNTLNAPEEIIVNGNELRKGKSFLNFDIQMSPDQNKVCVIMDEEGRNFFTIKIKDLTTGKWLPDIIRNTRNGCEWTNDSKTILYGFPDKETLRVYQIKKHNLGDKESNDVVLYEEKDETLDCSITKSRSEKYFFIDAERTDASQYFYTSADTPGELKIIQPLTENLYYTPDHAEGDKFLILTNYNAKNYRLVEAPLSNPAKENWKDIIPQRDDIFLNDVEYFKNFMVAEEMSGGLPQLRIIQKNKKEYAIQFDETAYYVSLGYNPEYNSDVVRFVYSSFTTPESTYDFNPLTNEKKLMKQKEVPGYNKENYFTERVTVTARDGKKIPLTLVYNKNKFKNDGTHAGLIYGYGSYGSSETDYFDANIISLLDRGFVYAVAHIRGGQEMGGQWYEDGKMLNKKNTFFDFIDCSEWLIKNKYVAKDKLFANGLSAGGLLMGAISNFRPDLYKGIIANVPFVDVMTTMEDETIPLTSFEWMEWGNPAIKEQYDYMLSYSPYDNIEKKNYPNMLVTTSYNDSQVQYFEPAKWVAKLRYMKTDTNLLLLKTNMNAGHGGAFGRYEYLKDVAFMYAFMLNCLK